VVQTKSFRQQFDHMTDIVPPAPLDSAGKTQKNQVEASPASSPLDATFLHRVYKSMVWFGIIVCLLMAFALKTAPAIGSFAGGYILAIVLLRLHEVTLRKALRPKSELGGIDSRLVIVLLLPLKMILVIATLVLWNMTGTLEPAPLAGGFFAAQLIIVSKVVGWLLTRKTA
jgi:hypothetical protein